MKKELDYAQYGYPDGTKIEIDSELYDKICQFVNTAGAKESLLGFVQEETLEQTFKGEAKHILTPFGLQLTSLSLRLNAVHEENVEKGIAVHVDELNKPKITLEK